MVKTKLQRWQWVDYAKGIGIFLVVLGHTIRGLVNASILPESFLVMFSDRWIYAFHIPLFFLLSGIFLERSIAKPFNEFFIDKLKTIVYPYFLWTIIEFILIILAGSQTNSQFVFSDLWTIIYEPIMQFWFLYVLFLVIVSYAILRKLGLSIFSFLIMSIIGYSILIFNINIGSWSVAYLSCRFAIYVALGVIFGNYKNLMNRLINLRLSLLAIISISSWLLMTIAVYYEIDSYIGLLPVIASLGIIASLSLAIILQKMNLAKFIQQWGIFSLEIYLVHTIVSAFIRIILVKFFDINNIPIHIILGTLTGVYIPLILALICKKWNFDYLFLWKK